LVADFLVGLADDDRAGRLQLLEVAFDVGCLQQATVGQGL